MNIEGSLCFCCMFVVFLLYIIGLYYFFAAFSKKV